LIYGDSHVNNFYFKDIKEINTVSHPGATSKELCEDLEFYIKEKQYDTIIIIAGTNDLGGGNNVDNLILFIEEMVHISLDNHIKNIIIVPPWSFGYNIQETIDEYFVKNNFEIGIIYFQTIPEYISDDGVHLSHSGNISLKELILSCLE